MILCVQCGKNAIQCWNLEFFSFFRGKKLGIVNDGCMYVYDRAFNLLFRCFFSLCFSMKLVELKKISCMCGRKIAIKKHTEMKNKQRRLKQLAEKWESHGWKIHESWASERETRNNNSEQKKKIWEKMHLWWQAMMEICGKNAKLFREQHFSFGISLIILVSTRSYKSIFRCHLYGLLLWKHTLLLCVCVGWSVLMLVCVGAPIQWRVRRTFWFSFYWQPRETHKWESEKK